MQWAAAGVLAAEPLLNACLHDQRFDTQCEDHRGEWLWKIIAHSGAAQQIRDPVLSGLRDASERDAFQLCELALHFARSGDEDFRKQLYDFVKRRQFPGSPGIGERQLLSLDGEEAFRFLARLRGQALETQSWEWDDEAVIRDAIDDLGETQVRELLAESQEPEIRRFMTGWLENALPPTEPESPRDSHIEQMRTIPVSEVMQAVYTEGQCNWLRGWGMYADEPALEVVLDRILAESTPAVLSKLLRAFSNRPLPYVVPRLIYLMNHTDRDVRHWAVNALGSTSHPLIRAFALTELRSRTVLERPPVSLLIKNFEPGDEQRLLDQVELPEDVTQRHGMLMDVIKLFERNESADCSKLGQIIYFHTPCQNCRFDAAHLLFDQGAVPDWLAEECRFDAEEGCRELGTPESDLSSNADFQ